MGDDGSPSRADLAQDRTELAEDRTLLANERTFSGWTRTSFATVGVGLAFHVLFGTVEPAWVAKAIATLFFALGILIIVMAERRACAVTSRLDAHQIKAFSPINLRLIAAVFIVGTVALIAAIWTLV